MPLTPQMIRKQQLAEPNARAKSVAVRERSYGDEAVTPEISLTVSAVLAAFTILTEDLSSLPLLLYERRGRNKFRAYDNMYYRLMHDQPNPEHTSMVFREFMVGHMLAWGNFFAQPIIDKRGDVVELWPLRPDRMTVKRFEGERIYIYRSAEGKEPIFLADEILHIPAFGFDGLIGYSRIALARNSIGLAISADKYGAKFFSNGAHADLVFKHPKEIGDEAYTNLKESLKEKTGTNNANEILLLEEDMSVERLGLPNDDAQFLETRKFQVSEVARIFRVPPHMIGDVEKTTSWGSGIDSQEQGYVNHTLRPWSVRIDQHLNTRLLPKDLQQAMYYEHLMDGLLRGDIAVRYEAYVKAITNGFMSRNEVRERENMNPRKGLDAMLQPLNMTTVPDGSAGGDVPAEAASALAPLWTDAVARVMKREKNDLLGASKRWQAKGMHDEYETWLNEFYSGDHLRFAQKQFKPILDAQARLFGADLSDDMDVFLADFLEERIEHCMTASPDYLAKTMQDYIESATKKILAFVDERLKIALKFSDEPDEWEREEESYE